MVDWSVTSGDGLKYFIDLSFVIYIEIADMNLFKIKHETDTPI